MNILATIDLMKSLHEGQVDKQGKPYWQHPVAVMELLGPDATLEEQQAAILHDVVEDNSSVTLTALAKLGFSDNVLVALYFLSRPKNVNYFTYIGRIAISGSRIAIKVKKADLKHNLDPLRGPIPDSMKARYQRALEMLDGKQEPQYCEYPHCTCQVQASMPQIALKCPRSLPRRRPADGHQ